MELEKYILAVITMNRDKVADGTGVFYCDTKEELDDIAKSLEAILDGIAHALSDEMYVIVKH